MYNLTCLVISRDHSFIGCQEACKKETCWFKLDTTIQQDAVTAHAPYHVALE